MLKPSNIVASCYGQTSHEFVPNQFSLMSWNIYKINHTDLHEFESYLQRVHAIHKPHFYCLQEAKHSDADAFPLDQFCLYFTANLQLKERAYGVMTASNVYSDKSYAHLSQNTEFLFKTHKTTLISLFHFADHTPLVVVNIHAINFKSTHAYIEEMTSLESELRQYDHLPLIIAGDFNCWSRRRHKVIRDFCRTLKLRWASFEDDHNVKRFGNNPLDLILYRYLDVTQAQAIDSAKVSDHNPLLVGFSRRI